MVIYLGILFEVCIHAHLCVHACMHVYACMCVAQCVCVCVCVRAVEPETCSHLFSGMTRLYEYQKRSLGLEPFDCKGQITHLRLLVQVVLQYCTAAENKLMFIIDTIYIYIHYLSICFSFWQKQYQGKSLWPQRWRQIANASDCNNEKSLLIFLLYCTFLCVCLYWLSGEESLRVAKKTHPISQPLCCFCLQEGYQWPRWLREKRRQW